MFTCKSLLLDHRNKIVDLNLIKPSWFTEVTDTAGLKKISEYIDRNYMDGVILLNYRLMIMPMTAEPKPSARSRL